MQTRTFQLDPTCSPDSWLLWIGPDQYGSVALHTATGTIKQMEYRSFDAYGTDVFLRHAAEIFADRSAIRQIRVAFRMDAWCWTPTAFTSEVDAIQKWISPFWPEQVGHRWVADGHGPTDATAWVLSPDHIRDQLHHLFSLVEYKHACGLNLPNATAASTSMELIRMRDQCWICIWRQNQFLYGQPHRIETAADLLYTLSMLTNRFTLDWSTLDIRLAGQWSSDSELLGTLQSRSNRIQFRSNPWANLLSDSPAHWFTPLYDLFACA